MKGIGRLRRDWWLYMKVLPEQLGYKVKTKFFAAVSTDGTVLHIPAKAKIDDLFRMGITQINISPKKDPEHAEQTHQATHP